MSRDGSKRSEGAGAFGASQVMERNRKHTLNPELSSGCTQSATVCLLSNLSLCYSALKTICILLRKIQWGRKLKKNYSLLLDQ